MRCASALMVGAVFALTGCGDDGGGLPNSDAGAIIDADVIIDAAVPRDVIYSPSDAQVDPPLVDGGLQTAGLFTVARDDHFLRQLDLNTGGVSAAVAMHAGATTPVGANGLAAHPLTGELFVLLKMPGGGGRQLAVVDPVTGALDLRGDTGDKFASLAFSGTGDRLYGVTGRGAAVPSSVYALDPSTAATTLVQPLGAGDDGEAIAWNPTVGFMYHASGLSNARFEVIDLVDVVLHLPWVGDNPGEILAFTWYEPAAQFVAVAQNGDGDTQIVLVDSTATVSPAVPGPLGYHPKGLAWVPLAAPAP